MCSFVFVSGQIVLSSPLLSNQMSSQITWILGFLEYLKSSVMICICLWLYFGGEAWHKGHTQSILPQANFPERTWSFTFYWTLDVILCKPFARLYFAVSNLYIQDTVALYYHSQKCPAYQARVRQHN